MDDGPCSPAGRREPQGPNGLSELKRLLWHRREIRGRFSPPWGRSPSSRPRDPNPASAWLAFKMAAQWQPAHRATPSRRSGLYDPLAFPFRSAPFQPLPSAEQRDRELGTAGPGSMRTPRGVAREAGHVTSSIARAAARHPTNQGVGLRSLPPPCSLLPPDLPSPFPAPSSLVTMEHKMAA